MHKFPGRASYQTQLVRLARVLTTVAESKSPNEQLTAVLKFYRPLLKNKYDDVQRRGRDLEHLQSIAKRYKTAAKLLEDISLDPTEAMQGSAIRRGGFVTLSTVHSAKGLEWSNVFIIWMTDGWFPSGRFQDEFDDLDEERRLLYVATTRAKKELNFVYPVNVYRGPDSDGMPALSRFLEPIPPEVLAHASLD
jgi:DNA helicase-2/ATP-dependent DNA helicase PcrA